MMKQKFKNMWLAEGDNNTTYFHKCVKAIINSNIILSLTREDNSVVYEVPLIQQEAVAYFSNFIIEGSNAREWEDDLSYMEGTVISPNQSSELIRGVTREEVKTVLFSMDSDKAPGPDGYNVHFYMKAWPIVGEEFIDAIQYFFEKGRMLKEMNNTSLTLIPKVVNPTRITNFRPIACCNVTYKCISKILANML